MENQALPEVGAEDHTGDSSFAPRGIHATKFAATIPLLLGLPR